MAETVPEASASHKAQKRERDDVDLEEIEGDQHKWPRQSLLSEFIFDEDVETLDTIEDETVLHVMKSLEKEISTTTETCKDKVEVGKIEISTASYEYLVSATDDELGIPPSPPAPLQENNGQLISQNFWNDLFENCSNQKGDFLEPFITYCYSNNYSEFEVYSSDTSDSDCKNWFVDEASRDFVLQDGMTLF